MFNYYPNIYTGRIPLPAVEAAIDHAKRDFPNESCGAVIDGEYVPFENRSLTPSTTFLIEDPAWYEAYMWGDVECIVHSHNDCNRASVYDQAQRQELDIASMIINLRGEELLDCIVFGEEVHAPFDGRPFFYGAFDCIALVADYYAEKFSIALPNPPHEWEFWARCEPVFEDVIDSDLFLPVKSVEISNLQFGDILLYNIGGTKVLNHVGVVRSDGKTAYHHLFNNVSGTYPVEFARQHVKRVMRLR